MRLYVEELKTELIQEFRVDKTINLERVRLHLVKYLSPAGTFKLSVLDSTDVELISKELTLAEMINLGGADLSANYYHGYVSFIFNRSLTLRPGTFKLRLSATGYTYADNEFIGWSKDWDDRATEITDGSSPVPSNSPYDYEFYSIQKV